MKFSTGILILTAAFAAACNSGGQKITPDKIDNNTASAENPQGDTSNRGWAKFESEYHDFGKITDGESVRHKFKFTNVGKGDLVISDVQAACGCTSPSWSKEVIPPGGEGYVETVFNSSGRGEPNGIENTKYVDVFFQNSTVETVKLTFRALVVKK
ncbi:MAG: hypothetical protein RL160_1270 [Bacteroidota bacterium]|jgi:hypothetical protein